MSRGKLSGRVLELKELLEDMYESKRISEYENAMDNMKDMTNLEALVNLTKQKIF